MPPQNEFDTERKGDKTALPAAPKKLKIFFRSIAVLGLLISAVTLLAHLSSVEENLTYENIAVGWEVLTGDPATWFSVGVYVLPTLVFLLMVVYYVGLFRLRRWTVPVSVFVAGNLLLTLAYRTTVVSDQVVLEGMILVSWLFAVLWFLLFLMVAWLSVTYRATLPGPAKRLWLQVPIVLLLLPGLLFVVGSLVFQDISSVSDNHLTPKEQPVLADEENAYLVLVIEEEMTEAELRAVEQAGALYTSFRDTGDAIDQTALTLVVSDTKRVTDSFLVASTLPGLQCPGIVNVYAPETLLCDLNSVREAAVLTSLRVQYELSRGNLSQAVRGSTALIEFAHHYETISTSAYLLDYLVANAVRKIGYEALDATLAQLAASEMSQSTSTATSSADLVLLHEWVQRVLEETRPKVETISETAKSEYKHLKASYAEPLGNLPASYIWHPKRTQQDMAHFFTVTEEYYRQECGSSGEAEALSVLESYSEKYEDLPVAMTVVKPNSIGVVMNSVVLSSLSDVKETFCETAAKHESLLEQNHSTLMSLPREVAGN